MFNVSFRGLYLQAAAARHGITRVDGQVHNDLFDLSRVRLDTAKAWLQIQL